MRNPCLTSKLTALPKQFVSINRFAARSIRNWGGGEKKNERPFFFFFSPRRGVSGNCIYSDTANGIPLTGRSLFMHLKRLPRSELFNPFVSTPTGEIENSYGKAERHPFREGDA